MTAHLPDFTKQLIIDGTKIGWYKDRVEAWKRGEKIAPVTIDYAMTRECQASCPICYAMLQENERKYQTKEIVFNFLEDAAEIGVKGVSFISDGESTVHKNYLEAVEHAHRLGLGTGASSNGVVLNKRTLERLLPCLTYLRFHFGGGTREGYAKAMGLNPVWYDRVIQNIKDAMAIKHRDNLPVNINVQMVCRPEDKEEIVPLAKLCRDVLRPDYFVIKHTADDLEGSLGINYAKYADLFDNFKEAEACADDTFRVQVKWSRFERDGQRDYERCYGPPFLLQVSGSGLVAPCGFLFNERYKKFHIGNICDTRFKDIWNSDRYWEVINYLASDEFNAQMSCGPNCLQTNTNSWLDKFMKGTVTFADTPQPPHMEFL
jgi:MoaA/NifB/PqqE/SkfB family radical SAM enzyme